jgi:hypothetical protein
VQRTHRDDHREGRAVGVGDDPLRPLAGGGRVDLGHHERDVGIHPERTGVVDDDRAIGHGNRCPGRRDLVRDIEHRDVDAFEAAFGERDDLDLFAAYGQLPPSRARRGDEPDLTPDVPASGQDLQHHRADGTGGTDHREGRFLLPEVGARAHRPVPP